MPVSHYNMSQAHFVALCCVFSTKFARHTNSKCSISKFELPRRPPPAGIGTDKTWDEKAGKGIEGTRLNSRLFCCQVSRRLLRAPRKNTPRRYRMASIGQALLKIACNLVTGGVRRGRPKSGSNSIQPFVQVPSASWQNPFSSH